MKKFARVLDWILSRRYNVVLKGEEVIDHNGPRLYLPNHQAEIDPVVLMAILQKSHKVAPMISEQYYNIPIFKKLLDMVGAVPVSDLDQGVRDANVMKTLSDAAFNAFKNGQSILLYPAGQLCNQGYEKVGNKQSTYNIVKDSPDNLKIIAVRMSGFWGSMWSRAWIGISPAFLPTFIKSIVIWFANFIFFIPKRTITFEFFDITDEAKEKSKTLKRREFNEFFETLYNANGEEGARYIRHHFLFPKIKRKIPKKVSGFINEDLDKIVFKDIKDKD